jgi:uncharacterized protein (TIGR03437 family)
MAFLVFLLAIFLTPLADAQSGPALAIDAAANRRSISPDIYGINDYGAGTQSLSAAMRVAVRRFGGDSTTRYNWTFDNYNSGSDYYFENYALNDAGAAQLPSGSYFDNLVAGNRLTHTKTLGTIPIIGWTTKSRDHACSFSVAKYGKQDSVDPYSTDCGNGQLNKNWLTNTDPHDTSVQVDQTFYAPWIAHLIATFGPANQGGVQIWSLDNEPEWWMGVHHDIHPNPASYDEVLSLGTKFAQMIKAADPSALVSGPIPSSWDAYFYSATDFVNGWNTKPYLYNDNPVDRNAHGGVAWLDWYLQQMHNYEMQHGQRLLDYLDVHAYVTPNNISFGEAGSAATNQLRLTSTRALWDPNYLVPDVDPTTPIELVPRLLAWVDNNYPGTKTAITEYNWGALDDITGALAQADILGIFGREGLDLATLWSPPTAGQPGVFAFEMYSNYDGKGSAFGETSIAATTGNPDQLSIFAAQRSDQSLIAIVINKTTGALTSPIGLANFQAAGPVHVYQYSSANLNAIVAQPDTTISAGAIQSAFPAYSITLFEIPAASNAAKPVINAVLNAGSYIQGAAPGEMVTIFGTGLGSSTPQYLALDSNGMVSNSLSGLRVLFDGIPAALVSTAGSQCTAMVPYFAVNLTTVNVQVEYQGNRSASFAVPVVASAPGLFTANQQGFGQASIVNQDGTINGLSSPAPRGSVVALFLTGEGQTNPPGFDGKVATSILPKPLLPVSVTIGGVNAIVQYAGAAPDLVAGVMQINVTVPTSISPSLSTPLIVKIGTASTASSVTLATY